ncbi:type III secretion system inner membrane channel protein [Yokenella regensburgei ATCC 49455]|uniref:Secretion system apparatus protein SsaV n=2 Tax=Yokenella regensburgei TaxID=158877 RepID=A0AB38G117_9ENTR|nr:type III secretion protein V [Yokenella regensburgei]KFD21376.1 type III secretion system inner membrane channel protein [Yokenella regensburgei ATCC 49455]SQA65275.1 Secretion system apparatus protein SsaV [Yokenella regensburgei]SQA66566.1 Secretion system apparatus protein SsaV [Yokenella regensburgei]SUQ05126.1 Secretion system apparatus protein SsaV [Yokenella regensburgei]
MQISMMKSMSMQGLQKGLAACAGRQDIILAVVLLIAIVMMILPLPTFMVDILIAVNIAFSVILLLIAIYINDPLDLSVFPSLLLITTLYRLSLTISTSRLVLLQHDAGNIVDAFGHFVVGGNLTVGLVIFTIITIIQFIVITKGTERVAEVSARFSLDGMPGKQMSIDGDLRAGVIDAVQARHLRQQVQQESRFLGAMDGAMKFVKGDAIAGIIVVLVNIIGGIIIAVVQYDMPLGDAVQTYSVLSIGDGLCGQIPSLLISLSAGIIVTRVPGEKKQNLASELTTQLGRQPQALMLTAAVLILFALIPGFPFLDFFVLAAFTALPFFLFWRRSRHTQHDIPQTGEMIEDRMQPGARPLTLHVMPSLNTGTLARDIDALRWMLFEEYGVPLPEITIRPDSRDYVQGMSVLIYQEPVFSFAIPESAYLLLEPDKQPGCEVQPLPDGMGSIGWLTAEAGKKAQSMGLAIAEGNQRITALLRQVLLRHMAEFIGVQEARYLMDAMEKRYSELVKELQRQLPISKITETLQRLVAESISIRDLRTVFGTLIEWAPREKDVLMLTEYVRMALRRHILHRLQPNGEALRVLRVGEGIENLIRESIRQTSMGTYAALSLGQSSRILSLIQEALAEHGELNIVTSVDARRFLRKITETGLFNVPVLSWQELGENCAVQVVHSIDLTPQELAGDDD